MSTYTDSDYYTDYTESGNYLHVPRTRSVDLRAESSKSSADSNAKKKGEVQPEEYVNVFSFDELYHKSFYIALLAEFLATSFFVAFSIGGIAAAKEAFHGDPSRGAEHSFTLIFHVFLVLIVIYAFGPISGSHFNSAVTIGTLFAQRVTIIRAVGYIIVQMIGAVVGTAVMVGAIPGSLEGNNMGLLVPAEGVKEHEAFLMEFYCTFGLVFGAFAVAFDPRGFGRLGPVAIAIIVALNAHVGGFVSGGAMNPGRAFGPAVIHGEFKSHWVYWAGDLLGGILGAVTYEYNFMLRAHARPDVPSTTGEQRSAKKKNN